MRRRFRSFVIISIILLSVLFVDWNFDIRVVSFDNKINDNSLSKFNEHSRDKSFKRDIEVISEPNISQNHNINASNFPKIAVENDKIYIVWSDKTDYNNAGGDSEIFYRHFDGDRWSEIQVISEPIPRKNLKTGSSGSPDIAVENGKIYVVWHDNNNTNGAGGDYDIFYRCNLTGFSWEDIQVISEPTLGQDFNNKNSQCPKIAVENNKIYIVWHDNNNTNGASDSDLDIFYKCNLTGVGWEKVQVISEPVPGENFNTVFSFNSDIAVENSKIYVVWQDLNNTNDAGGDFDIFYRCNLTGISWEPVQVISEPILGKNNNINYSVWPLIAVEDGNIHIVWSDDNNTNNAGDDYDIFYRCNLTGFSWEPIQIISEPVPGKNINVEDSRYPSIAVEEGNIYITWSDNNNTNNAGTDNDIFYRCNLTGNNWEEIEIISEPRFNYNFNTGISSFPDIITNQGKNYIVWQDDNNTNNAGTDLDIFYISISPILFLKFPKVIPNIGNTSTVFNFTISYYNLNNITPIRFIVNISGKEYSMLEVNPNDNNYKDGKEYYFNIKNLDIGLHTYKFEVSDGVINICTRLRNFPIVYNFPPNIFTYNNSTAIEDIYYKVDYEYEDIDLMNVGQPAFWDISTNANWLEFNRSTAVLNGTPEDDDVGEYWVNITINDTIDIDFTNFTLTVINVNDPPIIITDDIEITYEDEYYEVDYDGFDIDTPENNLIWTMDTNASWLRFESTTAILNGTPENDDVGEYWVKISVSDSDYMDYSNFTLKVINVNDPPRIITKDNITAFEDEVYEMDYEVEDVDNAPNELSWMITSNAQWLAIDTVNAIMNGTATNDDVGEYWVNVSVSDNEYFDFTNFTLTVVNTNDPPSIITEDKTNVTVGELYSVNYEAEDIDPVPTTLTWSLNTNASNWLTIDKITGWLNGVPAKGDAGIYWVNVSVSDNENGLDTHNFTLYVFGGIIQKNNAPVLSNDSITPLDGDINTEFTFSVHYYDIDGDIPMWIQLVIDDAVYNMKLKPGENASNGIYECRTTLTEGTHNYYFTASDGLEMVKTDNSTTVDIIQIDKTTTERISWYWLIWIVIFVIIIVLLTLMFIYKKYRAAKIPTVRAELLHALPDHIAFPGVTPSIDGTKQLPTQPTVSEQLPTTIVQAQPTIAAGSEKAPVPTLAPIPVTSQYQLPKDTLTKEQQLGLLQERFLRGEVSEETYKELKSKLESSSDGDITVTEEELEIQYNIVKQKFSPNEELTKLKTSINSTPEFIDIPPLQVITEYGPTAPEMELETETQQQQPQPTSQVQQQPKPTVKEQSDE